MYLMIRDNANSDARAELRARLKGIIRLAMTHRAVEDGYKDDGIPVEQQLREEVTAFWLALLGFAPTGDEMREMIGE